jgi:drug/metabolite transporter (DMT)-like permease
MRSQIFSSKISNPSLKYSKSSIFCHEVQEKIMLKRFASWHYAGPLAILFAAFLWSLDALMRQSLYSLPSMFIVFMEHALGLIITLPWLIKSWPLIRRLDRKTWMSIFWIAVFGGLLGTLAYTKALSYIQYINFSVVVLLQKLQPIFAIILARIILKEQFKGRFFLWVSLALGGSYLVAFPNIWPHWQDGGKNILAGLLAMGAAFAWGSSTVMGKYSLKELDTRVITPLRLGLTAIMSGLYLQRKLKQARLLSSKCSGPSQLCSSTGSFLIML